MTDRAADRAARKQETEDRLRITHALAVVERDANLRYMLARVLDACGMASVPFHPDPLTTAFNCGKMAAGDEFKSLLDAHDPALYFALMKEYSDAERQRAADIANKYAAD